MKIGKLGIRVLVCAVVVLALSGVAFPDQKEMEKVNIVGHQYSPYQNPDQSGFQNDLVREAFYAAGLVADISIVPPLRTIEDFYEGTFAVCSDGETITDKAKNKALDVTRQVYWNVPIGLMYYKPNLTEVEIKALEDVTNFSQIDPSMAILCYGGYDPYTEGGFKGAVEVRSFSPEQTMRMVKGGRYKLGFEVLGVTPYLVVTEGDPEDLKNWGFVNVWVYVPQYMAFKGKDPKGAYYEGKFNEGLTAIKQNGTYMDIYEKLYGKNNVPRSAIHDPQGDIREEDLSKLVDDDKFDMDKFLRQNRDGTGTIVEFVD